jgi:hypothetical protein
VAIASTMLLTLVDSASSDTVIEGRRAARGEDMRLLVNTISSDYLKTLRIPLIAGRDFARTDRNTSPPVAIVNDTMARRFWGSPETALGHRIQVGRGNWRTIVGVARDAKYARVTEDSRPHVYLPVGQNYWSGMAIHVRSQDAEPSCWRAFGRRFKRSTRTLPILRATMLRDQTRAALGIFS